jgi:HEAT repeat protein
MAGSLLAILEGKDAALVRWAKERGVVQGALYAKSAQLLGDVGGVEAVPALVAKLAYRDRDPGVEMYVRVLAAESLGRMRARQAVRPLSELVARERDANVRDRYCDALVRIGDAAAVPALKAAAAAGDWDLREGPLTALSRIGGPAEQAFVEAAKAKECPKGCAPAIEAAYAGMLARLGAAKSCADVACWAAKLGDAAAAVRDRAALEIGREGRRTRQPSATPSSGPCPARTSSRRGITRCSRSAGSRGARRSARRPRGSPRRSTR